jgi:hypothetical protein
MTVQITHLLSCQMRETNKMFYGYVRCYTVHVRNHNVF